MPLAVKLTAVAAASGGSKVTLPGPSTNDHDTAGAGPSGSLAEASSNTPTPEGMTAVVAAGPVMAIFGAPAMRTSCGAHNASG